MARNGTSYNAGFFIKKKINIYFKSKVSEISNDRVEDLKISHKAYNMQNMKIKKNVKEDWNEINNKQWLKNDKILEKFVKDNDIQKKYYFSIIKKINQIQEFKIIGSRINIYIYFLYLNIWKISNLITKVLIILKRKININFNSANILL